MFSNRLRLGYVPKRWRKLCLEFIPKTGIPSITKPMDFRQIRLFSFLLNTLERLLDQFIKGRTKLEEECLTQHAYLKGKSVHYMRLHTTVKSLHDKDDANVPEH